MMPRKRKCICGEYFQPWNTLQKACSPTCALELVRRDKAKKERKAIREAKKRLKTRSDWLKEAQAAFNKYIRLRDRHEPCISCGTTDANIQYAAGHYRTVGSCPELRFEELNCHKQCNMNCNSHKSGNIVEYRINLVRKIGADKVAWLEGPHEPKKYTIDEIKAIKAKYAKMARDLEKGNV